MWTCRQGGRAEARGEMAVAGYGAGRARVAAAADVLAAAVLRAHIGEVLRAVLHRPVCNSDTFWVSETDSATNRESITILRCLVG